MFIFETLKADLGLHTSMFYHGAWHVVDAQKMLGTVKGIVVKYLCSEGRDLRLNPTAASSFLCSSLSLSVLICKMGDQRWCPPQGAWEGCGDE